MGLAGFVASGLLVAGCFTPIAASSAGVGCIAIATGLLPRTALFIGFSPVLAFWWTILLAVIALGPGAFSVDARLFGRREIFVSTYAERKNQ